MKKLAVIGAHGVGKTTLCHLLSDYANSQLKRSVKVLGELARECPFPINEKMGYDTAEWIILSQILQEREAVFKEKVRIHQKKRVVDLCDIVICDRCAYDPYIYFKLLNKLPYRSNKIFQLAISHLWTYDRFILIEPSGKLLEEDGLRMTDLSFQLKVHREFVRDIESLPAINKKLTILKAEAVFDYPEFTAKEIFACL